MNVMTKQEASKMLGLANTDELDMRIKSHDLEVITYRLPRDAESQTGLAKNLAALYCGEGDCWIQLTYWHNDHGANQDLFYGYLRGQGDQRFLREASVYLFTTQDAEQFVSIFSMVLYFAWDASIFNSNISSCVQVSHDEWIDCASNDPAMRAKLSEYVSPWILPWP